MEWLCGLCASMQVGWSDGRMKRRDEEVRDGDQLPFGGKVSSHESTNCCDGCCCLWILGFWSESSSPEDHWTNQRPRMLRAGCIPRRADLQPRALPFIAKWKGTRSLIWRSAKYIVLFMNQILFVLLLSYFVLLFLSRISLSLRSSCSS